MKPVLKLLSPIINFFKKPFGFVRKNHYFIFSVIALAYLSLAVFITSITVLAQADQAYRDQQVSTSTSTRFDQQTINKIQNLRLSSDLTSPLPPTPTSGRINPFSE